jgi:hypothetical protein
MGRLNRIASLSAISIFCFALLSLLVSPFMGISSLNIFPQEKKPFGSAYVEQPRKFWNWTLGIPASDSPINDPTGAKCGTGTV